MGGVRLGPGGQQASLGAVRMGGEVDKRLSIPELTGLGDCLAEEEP